MTNNLTDLNNALFKQIEQVNDSNLTGDELSVAITKAETVTKIAEKIIKNGELQLKTAGFVQEYAASPTQTPQMLALKDNIGVKNEEV